MSCKKDHDIFNMFIKTFQKQFNFKVKCEENSLQRLSTWTVWLLNFGLHLQNNENCNLMLSGFLIMNDEVENLNERISNLYSKQTIKKLESMQKKIKIIEIDPSCVVQQCNTCQSSIREQFLKCTSHNTVECPFLIDNVPRNQS